MSLFSGSNLIKTKELGETSVIVGYFNGQIVAAANNGKVTIMNESFGIIKEFAGTSNQIQSICGDQTYLALCDISGSVRYYKRNSDSEPRVLFVSFVFSSTCFRVTSMIMKQIAFKSRIIWPLAVLMTKRCKLGIWIDTKRYGSRSTETRFGP